MKPAVLLDYSRTFLPTEREQPSWTGAERATALPGYAEETAIALHEETASALRRWSGLCSNQLCATSVYLKIASNQSYQTGKGNFADADPWVC